MTLHSSFSLPVQQNAKLLQGMAASKRNTFYSLFMNLKLIIIDEISLVGSRLFHNLEVRLRGIFNSTLPFGGVSLLVLGDFYQLRPVQDKFVFYGAEHESLVGSPIWELFRYYQLTRCMRQLDDQPFALALTHYR